MRRTSPFLLLVSVACAGAPPPTAPPTTAPAPSASASATPQADFRDQTPRPGKAGSLSYPAIESERLENGLALYVVPRRAEVVSLSVVVRHGQSSVSAGKSGLAALTARMLTEGTKKRSSGALAEAAESLGSTLEDDAGRDYSSIGIDTLRADYAAGLELLSEVVTSPAFARAEFERVRSEWLDGLTQERQTPERLASLAGLRLLLGPNHGAPVGGSIPDVKKLTVADLTAFHRAYYQPQECALVVVGDVELGAVKSAAAKAFGGWKAGSAPAPSVPPLPAARERTELVLVDRPGAVQSAVFVAQPFPKRSEAGHEARQLLNGLVGGLFTSRINQNLREKHAYTYGARSDAIATRHFGAFIVSTRVEAGVTGPALKELVGELDAVRDPKRGAPIREEEVGRARADLLSSLGAHLGEVSRIAGDVETSFVQGLGPRYYADFAEVLRQRTLSEVGRESQRIEPQKLVVVVVGDKSAVLPQLQAAGFSPVDANPELTQ